MRHQPWLAKKEFLQDRIYLCCVDRRQSKAREVGNVAQYAGDDMAENDLFRKVEPVSCEVDTREYNLAISLVPARTHLSHDVSSWDRARIPAAEWDHAERAPVVAAVLDLDIRAGAPGPGRGSGRGAGSFCREARPGIAARLFRIGNDAVNLRHGAESLGIDLGSAPGSEDPGPWPIALRPPDRLAGLPDRLPGDSATVHDNRIGNPCSHGFLQYALRLVSIQPAAEGDNLNSRIRRMWVIHLGR